MNFFIPHEVYLDIFVGKLHLKIHLCCDLAKCSELMLPSDMILNTNSDLIFINRGSHFWLSLTEIVKNT